MADGFKGLVRPVSARGWLQLALLLGLVAVLLSPALRAGFLWDDFDQIVNSATIGDPSRIPFYLTHNVVQSAGGEGRGADGVDTYRPLFMIALATVYQINGPEPLWFHLAVLLAHLTVCSLLWFLARRWLSSSAAATIAVLFFACHPVTSEAYLWSSALPEPMAAAGLLGAILILDRRAADGQPTNGMWGPAIAAGLVFFIGLLAKEVILLALPALGLYLVLARGLRPRYLLPAAAATIAFVVMRTFALAGLQATGADAGQRLAAVKAYPVLVLDGIVSMLTMQPIGIRHLSWEYADLGWGTSAGATLVCIAILGVAFAIRRAVPLALAAALTTATMLLPIALIATVPGWGGFGRYLYVPLAVTALALAELGLRAHHGLTASRPRMRWAVPVIVATALIIEQVGLRHALWVYANQENLARAAIEIFPDGPDGWEWLGNVHVERGELEEARRCFERATELGPNLFRPRHNLAMALYYSGRPAAALEQLEILDALHPPTAPGSNVAVLALMELGRWDEAAARLIRALDRDPDDASLLNTADRMIADHPDLESLERQVQLATQEQLQHPGAFVLMARIESASD